LQVFFVELLATNQKQKTKKMNESVQAASVEKWHDGEITFAFPFGRIVDADKRLYPFSLDFLARVKEEEERAKCADALQRCWSDHLSSSSSSERHRAVHVEDDDDYEDEDDDDFDKADTEDDDVEQEEQQDDDDVDSCNRRDGLFMMHADWLLSLVECREAAKIVAREEEFERQKQMRGLQWAGRTKNIAACWAKAQKTFAKSSKKEKPKGEEKEGDESVVVGDSDADVQPTAEASSSSTPPRRGKKRGRKPMHEIKAKRNDLSALIQMGERGIEDGLSTGWSTSKNERVRRVFRYRHLPSRTVKSRMRRALNDTNRLCLIDWTFDIANPLRRCFDVVEAMCPSRYTVLLTEIPSCNCATCTSYNLCSHIAYVYVVLLRLHPLDPIVYQRSLLEHELEAAVVQAPPLLQLPPKPWTAAATDASDPHVVVERDADERYFYNRIEYDGTCAVCFKNVEDGVKFDDRETIRECVQCRFRFHSRCYSTWKTATPVAFACPVCDVLLDIQPSIWQPSAATNVENSNDPNSE
jgi:hypothetical protein